MPWAEVLPDFRRAVADMGGMLVVTCRPQFWRRIADVLDETIHPIQVQGFSVLEVRELLSDKGHDPDRLNAETIEKLRNPRVLAVAADLLDDLAGHDLTLDRLHWSYWKHYWRGRADTSLSDEDFKELLVRHAKQAGRAISAGHP